MDKFQFHTGAIKGPVGTVLSDHVTTFQFHTGAIKGTPSPSGGGSAITFQFHTGAIKGRRRTLIRLPYISFNSILVRLKVAQKVRR